MYRQILVAALLVLLSTPFSWAADTPPASPEAERIETLVNKAAARVQQEGKAALNEFRKRGSEWWSGDVYVFAYAPDGVVLLNPAVPSREGHAYHGEKDKKGKAFHDEIIQLAKTKGSGWIDYWLPKPGQTEPSHKWSYIKSVNRDGVLVVGAGFFPKS